MSETCTVIVGAKNHLQPLSQRVEPGGEVLTFTDVDVLPALDAMLTKRPQVVILERLFAATSRGAALINRIKADPTLTSTEIRVVSHDGTYSRVSPRRQPKPLAETAVIVEPPAIPPTPLDYHGTRRIARVRMAEGTEVQLDGRPAALIDLTPLGAQILSAAALKPLQRLKVGLADSRGVVRLDGHVVWAFFETTKDEPRYRAGIEFKDAERKAVEGFSNRHKKG
jgi:hypothetical protein